MKALSENVLDALEDAALESVKHIKACLAYQGDNPTYYRKAKIGAITVNSFVNARRSEIAREMFAAELDRQQQRTLEKRPAPRAISGAK